MLLPSSSNGFRENVHLAIMVLEKNSVCAKSQVLGDVGALGARGLCEVIQDVAGTLGAELEFMGRGWELFHTFPWSKML